MTPCRGNAPRSTRGTTLIEVIMAAAATAVVLGGALSLMLSSRGAFEVGGTKSSLQEVGRRTVDDLLAEIRRSGLSEVGAQSHPAIWERPIEDVGLGERGPIVATMNYEDVHLVDETLTYEGNGNRIERNRGRITNELTFQIPGDLDGDGSPLDIDGNMEWLPEVFCYRVERELNGVPWLYRVTELNGVETDRSRVAPWVSNITFDVVFNDRSLGFGTIAVVVYMERVNAQRQTITAALEGAVVLRNTREL